MYNKRENNNRSFSSNSNINRHVSSRPGHNRTSSNNNQRTNVRSNYSHHHNLNNRSNTGSLHNNSNTSRLSRPNRNPRTNRRQPSLRSTLRQKRSDNMLARKKDVLPIPEPGNNIRIVPIGGVEEIGKNMIAVEIGNDIIVIDAGFQFKDANTPGIDYILPNTTYLEERKEKIRGLFITHGHLDHIGAIPYVLGKIGNPPIYARKFGALMVQKKMEDFPHLPKPDVKIIDGDETMTVGNIKLETFPISHTIPDSMGIIIHTEHGEIVIVEDVRVDNVDGVPTDEEVEQYKRFKDRDILLLTMDSTSIEKPGFSISENVVVRNIEKIIKETPSRLIIGTFASQVERILAIIEAAERYNKKVVIEGRSMKSNLEIVKYLGLVKTDNIIPVSEMESYPPDRIVMLVTGAQGEEFAALMRMANRTHKYVTLKKTDTVLLSSSIIPTNYQAVVKLKDILYRSDAKVITYLDSDVHASGHGNRDELKWIHEQIPYKFFMPVHGQHYMLKQHAEMAMSLGVKEENIIVPDNGSIIEIIDRGEKITKLAVRAAHEPVTVDGLAVGTIQDVVLEDRQLLAESGIFVVVASINIRAGKLKKSPDIISRGFVYLRESQDLLSEARLITKKTIEGHLARNRGPVDFDRLKKLLGDELTKFLFQETAKQPLVIPVLIGV